MRCLKIATLFMLVLSLFAPAWAIVCPECGRVNDDSNKFCNWCGAELPFSSGRIAFSSDRTGNWEIFVMDADGRNQTQLTSDGGASPTWSPDGRRIAFHSGRPVFIYIMNVDGGNVQKLTDKIGMQPAWSPDGQHFAFVCSQEGDYDMCIIQHDGRNLQQVTDIGTSPDWNPDGKRIVFESTLNKYSNIYTIDADGSNLQRLTYNVWDCDPAWSPDGRRIAFVSYRNGNGDIFVMNADGSNQTQLTNNESSDGDPSWCPVE